MAAAQALENSPRAQDKRVGRQASAILTRMPTNDSKGKACWGAAGLGGDIFIALECDPDETLLATDASFRGECGTAKWYRACRAGRWPEPRKQTTRTTMRVSCDAPGENRTRDLRFERPIGFGSRPPIMARAGQYLGQSVGYAVSV
ncbi:MAG: hypothetical protein ACYCUM_13685 [Solirubrobacteraceae bacterium]